MALLYKEDWEQTKKNFMAWWNGEYTGRCLINACAPKEVPNLKRPALPEKPEGRFLDFEYLHEINEYNEYNIYHVDGEGSFNHVDALCSLPKLQALQILPGDGKPSPLHYINVLKKVQANGKNLHIDIAPEEIETALEMLSAKGLFIDTSFRSEEEAKYYLSKLEKWSKVR